MSDLNRRPLSTRFCPSQETGSMCAACNVGWIFAPVIAHLLWLAVKTTALNACCPNRGATRRRSPNTGPGTHVGACERSSSDSSWHGAIPVSGHWAVLQPRRRSPDRHHLAPRPANAHRDLHSFHRRCIGRRQTCLHRCLTARRLDPRCPPGPAM
jgi:hypothetical protein